MPPSFDEMKDALDLRSKSGIHRLITALEERGFIRRLRTGRARSKWSSCPNLTPAHRRRSSTVRAEVIEGDLGRVALHAGRRRPPDVAIPVIGRIAAGTPIKALQTEPHHRRAAEMLAEANITPSKVRRDTMIEAGNSTPT